MVDLYFTERMFFVVISQKRHNFEIAKKTIEKIKHAKKKNNSKRQSINGKEFDTYKVGTVANSCSTMHKIHAKEFTLEDFSCEHLDKTSGCVEINSLSILESTVNYLNLARDLYLQTKDKKYWWQMIQLLPISYNQKRTVMLNYEVLANIYKSRKNHKLDEWVELCKWIESLPYSELITGERYLKYADQDTLKYA